MVVVDVVDVTPTQCTFPEKMPTLFSGSAFEVLQKHLLCPWVHEEVVLNQEKYVLFGWLDLQKDLQLSASSCSGSAKPSLRPEP